MVFIGFVDEGFVEGFVDEGYLSRPDTGHRTAEDSHRSHIDFALVSNGFH
jgi:hypothetical protein